MKLGLILECTPDGADVHVCRQLIKMINQRYDKGIQLATPATLINKPGLLQRCGESARQLLEDQQCDRVVIVWDIDPRRKFGEENCLVQDRNKIFAALHAANVDTSKIFLAGISRELDSWLTADGRAISACISMLTRRKVNSGVEGARRPEEHTNPKDWLSTKFREHGIGEGYNDFKHAKYIIQCLPDFREIRSSASFVRFVLKVADVQL